MAQNPNRPLSPHVWHYKWGPHMMASIIHRVTGFVLATAGMMTLLWWLYAIASGPEAYASFQSYAINAGEEATPWQVASNWFFRLIAVLVTLSFFQHFFSGLRHLLMDMGAGYELNTNKTWSIMVFIASITATGGVALFFAYRYLGV
jgi:succinate dehydrogenase / fumarate reductase, cytochrome b subunit